MKRALTMMAVILGVQLGGHFVVFQFVCNSLAVTDPTARLVLLLVFAFLALSFPSAASLVHLRQNALTASYYVFAATWLGLCLHLLLAIGLAWISGEVASLAGYTLPRDIVALVVFAAAVSASAIGAWRAFHPRSVYLDIALRDLPRAWEGKRVVQLSDLHLGFIHRRRFAEHVVAQVRAAEPELVVITGDLVDGMGGDVPYLVQGLAGLTAPHGVYFTSGNHEAYRGIGRIRSVLAETSIQVLDDAVVDLDGLRLIGVSFPGLDRAGGREILARLRAAQAEGGPSILLFHTPTNFDPERHYDGDQHVTTYWMPELSCTRARELGIDLQLSGHTHAGQLFPFTLLAGWIFKRQNYGLHREGDFQIYVSSGTGTWGPPVRTGCRSEITVLTLRRR